MDWLRDLPELVRIELVGEGQELNLDGLIDRVPSLMTVTIHNVNLKNLGWMKNAKVNNVKGLDAYCNNALDLNELIGLPNLREVRTFRALPTVDLDALSKHLGLIYVAEDFEPQEPSYVSVTAIDAATFEICMDVDVPGSVGIDSAGYEPSGHLWLALINHLVATQAPDLTAAYMADPESDTLAVQSRDRDTAERLRSLLEPLAKSAETTQLVLENAARAGRRLS